MSRLSLHYRRPEKGGGGMTDLSQYVEVSERIEKFYEKYPEGSLQGFYRVETIGEQTLIVYVAEAYRNPDDLRPGVGTASEPFPGKTNFTRDSELMNAETSAWGRAIAGLGFEVRRGIASANEVRNRRGTEDKPQPDEASKAQKASITRRCKELGIEAEHKPLLIKWVGEPLTKGRAGKLIELLKEAEDFPDVFKRAGLPNPSESRGGNSPTESPRAAFPGGAAARGNPSEEKTLEDVVLEPGGAEALGLEEYEA